MKQQKREKATPPMSEAFCPKVYPIAGTPEVLIQTRYAKGLYFKTHVCVTEIACAYCGALRYVPCTTTRGFWHAETHARRRDDWQTKKKRLREIERQEGK